MRIHNGTAYKSKTLDRALKDSFNEEGLLSSESMIKRIAMVGLLANDQNEIYPNDAQTMEHIAYVFNKAALPFHKDFEGYYYNFLPPMSNDIFRTPFDSPDTQVDLLIILYLPAFGSHDERLNEPDRLYHDFSEVIDDYINTNRLRYTSRKHSLPGAWPLLAEQLGARFIITQGGDYDEINTSHFEGSDKFNIIHATPSYKDCQSPFGDLGIIERIGQMPSAAPKFKVPAR